MNKKVIMKIKSNELIAKDVYKMILEGDTSEIKRPGQFVNIKLENKFLRRPISVCDYNSSELTIIYKILGSGTDLMSKMKHNQKLDLLMGLWNGFDLEPTTDKNHILLVGGGVGIPPLYNLAKELKKLGKKVTVVMGFRSKEDVFYEKELNNLVDNVYVVTNDGSYGDKGFVTDVISNNNIEFDYYMSCGPEPMLNLLCTSIAKDGQLSFEERMGCGFGACMGCSCKTKYGYKRICVEGPVLSSSEVIIDE